ncbi:MAG: hypothetical protein ACOY4H_15310 [Thermodesulfobacteriota bacterium]
MKQILSRIHFPAFFLFLFLPAQAWALQPHGEPEGMYVHQMAHILFSGALLYLYLHTRSTPDLVSRGWRYLQMFCLLTIAWNITALVGHYVSDLHSQRAADGVTDIVDFFYTLTRMDHFLFVPAIFALLVCLRTFYREAGEEKIK